MGFLQTNFYFVLDNDFESEERCAIESLEQRYTGLLLAGWRPPVWAGLQARAKGQVTSYPHCPTGQAEKGFGYYHVLYGPLGTQSHGLAWVSVMVRHARLDRWLVMVRLWIES